MGFQLLLSLTPIFHPPKLIAFLDSSILAQQAMLHHSKRARNCMNCGLVYKCCIFQFISPQDSDSLGRQKPKCRGNAPENFILLGSFPICSLTTERHTGSGGDEVAVRHMMAVVAVFVTLVLGTA